MSFRNSPNSIIVPDTATPGSPGLAIGVDIPPELQTYYTAMATPMAAVILWYSNQSNYYRYEGLLTNGTRVAGYVFNLQPREEWRDYGVGPTFQWFGFDAANATNWVFGGNGGGGGGDFTYQSGGTFRLINAAGITFNGADYRLNSESYNLIGPAYNITTLGNTLIAGATVSFQKFQAASKIQIALNASGYANSPGAGYSTTHGVRINGVDYDVSKYYFNVTADHRAFGNTREVAGGVAAGTYTVQAFARISNTGAGQQFSADANDTLSFTIEEVAP